MRTPSSIPLEVDTLKLETLREQSADEVATTLIHRGNTQQPIGEFFDVSGSAKDDETLIWQGDCSRVKLIGADLTSGTVRVEGTAGMHLGARMSGGVIIVEGDATDWVGAEMSGGRITVMGNAGHLVGAAYRGGRRGMTGGEILVHGNVGNELGHTMRRGLIAVAGNSGDAAAVGMIAGTIFVFGEPGIRNGAGMKRGTLGFFSTEHPCDILPTFKFACRYQPSFLTLYFRHLLELGFPVPQECLTATYRRFCGDLLETGKGELLIREAA